MIFGFAALPGPLDKLNRSWALADERPWPWLKLTSDASSKRENASMMGGWGEGQATYSLLMLVSALR
jgi:hypothetical protein